MPETFRGRPLQSPERPDTFFGLVAGLYVAALVSPALLVTVAVWLTSDPALLYVGLLGIVTAVTGLAGWRVSRWRGLAEGLGRTSLAWLLPLLGLLSVGGYFAVATVIDAASGVAIAGFFTGMLAMLLGFGLLAMSRTRYAKAVVDEDTIELEFEAAWPERRRLWVMTVAVALLVASAVTLALRALGVIHWDVNLIGFAPGIAGVALSLGTERTYRVTPVGLERRMPALRQFHAWDSFSGFSVTEDALVVHRRQSWRLDFRCARDDLADLDAVVATLEQHLDRTD